MNSQDWERFGEEIRRTVQSAVDSQDFRRLNQTISDTINRAAGSAAWGMKNFGETVDRAARNMGNYGQTGRRTSGEPGGAGYQNSGAGQAYRASTGYAGGQQPILYKSTTGAKAGSILMMVFGYGLGGVGLLLLIATMLVGTLSRSFDIGFQIVTAMLLLVTGIFGTLAGCGTSKIRGIGRFQSYLREIGGREYCNIKELENRLRKPAKYIVKDIERMIRRGWFRQGHLDKQKSCLILTDRAYSEYLQIEARREEQQRESDLHTQKVQEKEAEKPQEKETDSPNLSPEVKKIIEQGDAYIRKIHECNEAIPGEEISAKITRMELLVDRIFDRVEQNPETVPDIRKLMEYYLPTTVKLLEAYEQLDRQPVGGENIRTAKREIEATLDTLNTAFEKLLDSLFQDTAWDVSSDISVLHTMLAQEGLTEDGLKK